MNLYGPYRKLLRNSKQAMFAAIEIYNKPKFDYREEVFVILLVNAWDLLLLAILSKNKQRIFQKKKKGQQYKTLDFNESYKYSRKFFTLIKETEKDAIKINLESIRDYRNKTIHYYADKHNQHAIYALSQSAIRNYVDLLKNIFNENLINEINIVLLPLSFNNQPNFVEFFNQNPPKEKHEFVEKLFKNLKELENNDPDTDRFITQCSVKIERVKNIKSSDFTSTYDKESNIIAWQKVNPDESYPFYQKDIIGGKNNNKDKRLEKEINQYSFQAITFHFKLKTDEKYCWQSKKGGSPRYSFAVIKFINELSEDAISKAKKSYKSRKQSS